MSTLNSTTQPTQNSFKNIALKYVKSRLKYEHLFNTPIDPKYLKL